MRMWSDWNPPTRLVRRENDTITVKTVWQVFFKVNHPPTK